MRERLVPIGLAALFLVLGSFALDLPGVQTDEALFASIFYEPKVPPVPVRVLGFLFPAMCFPYIGALKSGIYALIWRVFEPSASTVHLPVVVIGALTIYIFARLLQRTNQRLWAALLLATDATYLMTTRSDWGPVALQHLLAMCGVYAGVRYAQTTHLAWVAAAGFAFGLGFWEKITFLWVLFALGAGVLATARHLIKPLPVAVLALFFTIGCYPLIVFNVKTGGSSFEGNAALDRGSVWLKVWSLWLCLGDVNLFGARKASALPPIEPITPIASIVSKVDYAVHPYLPPVTAWLFVASLLYLPRLFRVPGTRFYLVALLAGYGYMFALKNAGGGPHHIVLLWPLPHLLIAQLPLRRWMIVAAVAANLLQINHFYAQFLRREVSVEWSDATANLAARLKDSPTTYRVLDWGIIDSIYLLNEGRTDLLVDPPLPQDPNWTTYRYVAHTPQLSVFPIDTAKFTASGYRLEIEEIIADSAGRPVFLIYRAVAVEGK
ncbi:MAG: glycosyltransferase family 39 protein [Bryobacteraceae bacterium]